MIKTKINKYINQKIILITNLKNKIKSILFGRLLTLHENVKQHNVESLPEITFRNPYQVFFDWLLETLQYGLVLWFIYVTVTSQRKSFIMLIISFGMIRWFWLDIVEKTKKSMNN